VGRTATGRACLAFFSQVPALPAQGMVPRREGEQRKRPLFVFGNTSPIPLQPTPFQSVVTVAIHVLDDDGAHLAAAITAASLALIDAGVPCWDVVAAAAVVRVEGGEGNRSSSSLCLDPTAAEAGAASASLTLAVLPTQERVTQAVFSGAWGPDGAEGGLGLGSAGAAGVGAAMREALKGGG
jgi:ribonuclease PH